jgi:8-oxo-dGTP pyrophosphatase MutT (NUDIX family)
MSERKLRWARRPGVTAVVLNGKRILLLKRISIPFIVNPGMWYFVGGSRKGRESALENAYREIREELSLEKDRLTVVSKMNAVIMDRRKGERWRNRIFIMRSSTREVRLNLEHRGYSWVTFAALGGYKELLASLGNADEVLSEIRSALKGS